MNFKEKLIENKNRLYNFDDRFYKIFKVHISKFQDSLFLFDVVKFDRQVIKSKERNDSPDNLVKKDFDIIGQRLIREILELPSVKREKKVNKIKHINKIKRIQK